MDEYPENETRASEGARKADHKPADSPPSPSQVIVIREETRSARRLPWGFTVFAVAVAVLLAVWMTHLSDTLSGIHSTVNQNAQTLSSQQSLLSAMRQQLYDLRGQLAALAQQIGDFFNQFIHRAAR